MKTVVKYLLIKLLIVVFLALAIRGVISLVLEASGHLEVQMEQYEGFRSLILKQGGLMDIIPMQNEWEPCERLEEPLPFREKYLVYFLPGEDGVLEAQVYLNSKLLKTAEVKWYSGEEYYCNSQPGQIEGIIVTDPATAESFFAVHTKGILLVRYYLGNTPNSAMVPYEVREIQLSLLKEGNYIIVIPQEDRFVLFSGSNHILAVGKVKNP